MTARSRISMPQAAMALALNCFLLAGPGVVPAMAAVQGVPLSDDTGGVQALPPGGDASGVRLPPFLQESHGQASGGQSAGNQPYSTMTNVPGEQSGMGLPQARDATIIAYLIELVRRQGDPCPSGATPPVPPPLVFSERLSRVAHAVLGGADVQVAAEAEGIQLARWRLFSAGDSSARTVVDGLRQTHCEALLEPYSLIGAARGAGGWRVLLAVQRDPENAPSVMNSATPGQQSSPVNSGNAGKAPASPAVTPVNGGVAGINSQRPRELFLLLNERRVRGGTCAGKTMPPSSPLVFDAALQAEAEKDLARSGPLPYSGLAEGYKGSLVTKITGFSQEGGTALLDRWFMTSGQCEVLLSPEFTNAGIAVANDSWVLVLGGKGRGVPSVEPPGAAARHDASFKP